MPEPRYEGVSDYVWVEDPDCLTCGDVGVICVRVHDVEVDIQCPDCDAGDA